MTLRALVIVTASAMSIAAASFAGVFGDDGRLRITDENRGALGLTSAEVVRIRSSTGIVTCPNSNPNASDRYHRGSGVLVGSNHQVLTAAHNFEDKQGRRHTNLADCYFTSQGFPPQIVRFDFESDSEKLGTEGIQFLNGTAPSDYAVVQLREEIVDAQHFTIAANELDNGRTGLVVSAFQDLSGSSRTIPFGQVAQIIGVNPSGYSGDDPRDFDTSADVSPGGSGGPWLAREAGELVVAGIVINSTILPEGFHPPADAALGHSTRIIGIEGRLRRILEGRD